MYWFYSADVSQALLLPGTPSPERLGRELTGGKRLPGSAWLLSKDAEVLLPQHPLPHVPTEDTICQPNTGVDGKLNRRDRDYAILLAKSRYLLINGASKKFIAPN